MRKRISLSTTIELLVLIVFVILIMAPFVMMLINSFRLLMDLVKNGPLSLPSKWTFANYTKAITKGHFVNYYKSSVIITVTTVVFTLALVQMASYAMVYMNLPLKKVFTPLVLVGLVVPFELIMLPLFSNLRSYGWMDNYLAVIIPQIALNIPMAIVLDTTFMRKVPFDMIEAARIDGASEVSIMVKVVTPLVKPILSTLLVFVAMGSWNNLMLPSIMLHSEKVKTITVGLNAFKDSNKSDIPLICAASFISAIPIVIVYIIFQQKIQEGLTAGSVKE